jgi:outer membrane receptor for Fe3+-dicitrate
MKARTSILAALAALQAGAFAQGCAHEQNAVQTSPNKSNESYLTGSYLPQDVERNGPVTNGKNDVRVIDRSDINQSGGADVKQSLRQLGVTH